MSNFQQSCALKMAGRRAKLSEIWASGMSIQCIQDTCEVASGNSGGNLVCS